MTRVNIQAVQPAAYEAMFGLEKYLAGVDLPPLLIELVKTRASQINGCAYCIDMHSNAALEKGESTKRLFALAAWRESPIFTSEERAVLALTEEVTHISNGGVSDAVWQGAAQYYSETQMAQLVVLITTINAWNRVAIATQVQ